MKIKEFPIKNKIYPKNNKAKQMYLEMLDLINCRELSPEWTGELDVDTIKWHLPNSY